MKAVDKLSTAVATKFDLCDVVVRRSRGPLLIRPTIRIPVHILRRSTTVPVAVDAGTEIGCEPTPEELAAKLQMLLEKVRKVMKIAMSLFSLGNPDCDEEDSQPVISLKIKNAVLLLGFCDSGESEGNHDYRVLASPTPREAGAADAVWYR
jgi:RNA polymerase primary sigma factor